jgi:tagatose-1,6-bisphosphate aldolase non-catalytic subunit AgaZ/GatZ
LILSLINFSKVSNDINIILVFLAFVFLGALVPLWLKKEEKIMILPDESKIRKNAIEKNMPILEMFLKHGRHKEPITFLAICPNSEAVVKSAIIECKKANTPVIFAATLNQVDLDRGYTGWTQEDFLSLVRKLSKETGYNGPIIVGLDHGGPWLKDIQTIEKWPIEKCMAALKDSLIGCLEAGYDLLHIDPTVDKTLAPDKPIDMDTVVKRTLELIEHVERYRREKKLSRISYEVGTEEVHGGLADVGNFRCFLNSLKDGLNKAGLSDVWPIFIVGKVGTDLHTATFDSCVAHKLNNIVKEYGSFIKGHYTDSVLNPKDYPLSGMGGANIGPEFTEREYFGLMKLVEEENKLSVNDPSEFKEILTRAVIDSGRWKKWLQSNEKNKDFNDLESDRKEWLTRTGCRYIWAKPEVIKARKKLYDNLKNVFENPEKLVLDEIGEAIKKYLDSFNLKDIIDRVEETIEN